jgi:hypothetical protein
LTLRKDFGFKWLKHRNLELNGITKEKSTHIDFLTHKPIPDIEWNKYNFPKGQHWAFVVETNFKRQEWSGRRMVMLVPNINLSFCYSFALRHNFVHQLGKGKPKKQLLAE